MDRLLALASRIKTSHDTLFEAAAVSIGLTVKDTVWRIRPIHELLDSVRCKTPIGLF